MLSCGNPPDISYSLTFRLCPPEQRLSAPLVPLEVFAIGLKRKAGGADGIRTHDLLDAIEARSQLRHGPTELPKFTTGLLLTTAGLRHALPRCNPQRTLQVLLTESKL